ncbi:MAG: LCP family protein [Clostridia bacterium]|nr:LCP family protein [Clostridia bacterium]
MHNRTLLSRTLFILLLVLLSAVFCFSAFQLFKQQTTPTGTPTDTNKTLIIDGVEYFPRQDITTFLLMGIDEEGPVAESESYNNAGAADMLALVVFDHTDEAYCILMLNRDTVTEMNILGIGGAKAGTVTQQIALAHTYGTGLSDSCENTVDAAKKLLKLPEIDYYLSINMDAIALLTDAVGGVTVEVKDDFSAVDPTITKGTLTLTGSQAKHFVQGRRGVGDELNTSRLSRHESFIRAFLASLDAKLDESELFASKVYSKIEDYSVSDLSATNLTSMFSRYKDYAFDSVTTIPGKTAHPDGFMEFHPDEKALERIILDLFYSQKKL